MRAVPLRDRRCGRLAVLLAALMLLGAHGALADGVADGGGAHGAQVSSGAQQRDVAYNVTDLGTFGGELSNAFGVNDRSEAVGRAQGRPGVALGLGGEGTKGFLWRDGQLTDIGALSDAGGGTTALAINNNSEVVGDSLAPDPELGGRSAMPFYWSERTGMINLGQDLTRTGTGRARGINDDGVVVGVWRNRAFTWSQRAGYAELELLPDAIWDQAEAMSINNGGVVVGWGTDLEGFKKPVRWRPDGSIEQLATLAGGRYGVANEINALGQIAGEAELEVDDEVYRTRPVLWHADGTVEQIPLVPAEPPLDMGYAEGINDHGTIVGWDFSSQWGDGRQVGWVRDRRGNKQVLNDLVDAHSGWDIRIPLDINNRGEIVGIGQLTRDGVTYPGRAFIARPAVTIEATVGPTVQVSGTATFGAAPLQVGTSPAGSSATVIPGVGMDLASASIWRPSHEVLAFDIAVHDMPQNPDGVPELVHYEWALDVRHDDRVSSGVTLQAVRTAQAQQPGSVAPVFRLLVCTPGAGGTECTQTARLTGEFLSDRVRIFVPTETIGVDLTAVLTQARDGVVASYGVSGVRWDVGGAAGDRLGVGEYTVHAPSVVLGIAPADTPDAMVPVTVSALLLTDGRYSGELALPAEPGDYKIVTKACLGPSNCRFNRRVVTVE